MAAKARFAASLSEDVVSSRSRRGVICQEKPQRSLHQPQALSAPPLPTTAFQYRSVSSWSSVTTMKLTASLALKFGPPFSPTKRRLRTVNSTVSSTPSRPPGKSSGAAFPRPTALLGKVAA